MKTALAVMAAACLWAESSFACDDHVGECEIEAWRWHGPVGGYLTVDGAATCDEGMITIRLYEGDGGRFLGVAEGIVEGHAFQAVAADVDRAADVAIKYSIRR